MMEMRGQLWGLMVLVACGSNNGGSGTKDAPSGSGGHDAPVAHDAADARCIAPGYGSGSGDPEAFTGVIIGVSSGSGSGIANVPVSITGLDLSFSGETNANGNGTVQVNHTVNTPMALAGDGLTYPRIGEYIPGLTKGIAMHTAPLPVVGAQMSAGNVANSGPVAVTLAAGTTITYDVLDYPDPSSQQLRAIQFGSAALADYGQFQPDIVELFGVAPLGTTFCPPAQVSVPNTTGLSPNASVIFYGYGIDVGQTWEPYAGFQQLSTGKVSADGLTISTDPTQGLPVLDNFGVAPAH